MAGAGAAFRPAPRSGPETRRYITERGNAVGGNVARRAHDLAEDVHGRTEGWLDRGRDLLETETQRLRNAIDAGREALRDAFDAGREAMREEIRRITPP